MEAAIVADQKAGPIRYTEKNGSEYVTLCYLAIGVSQPTSLRQLLQPLLTTGRVTHGKDILDAPLAGWNLVVDVSTTKEETMRLPERMDRAVKCFELENCRMSNTVFLALYAGVSFKTDMYRQLLEITAAPEHVATVLVATPDPSSFAALKAVPRPRVGGRSMGRGGGGGAPVTGRGSRGAGRGRGNGPKVNTIVLGGKGSMPSQGPARQGGRKAGGGKGKSVEIADGLKASTRGGKLHFFRSNPY